MHDEGEPRCRILITGARGMLGGYVKQIFTTPEYSLILGLDSLLPEEAVEGVVHLAGSEEDADKNIVSTKKMLDKLQGNPPCWMVYVSSHQVYPEKQHTVEEDEVKQGSSDITAVGRAKLQCEEMLENWCVRNNVVLTVLRPGYMFGSGIKGEMADLFGQVISGRYVHIRGNDARLSIVTAYDVARVIKAMRRVGGIYNVASEYAPTLLEIAEAMSSNAGALKRPWVLPETWAHQIWRFGKLIPIIDEQMNPDILRKRKRSIILSTKRLREAGIPDLYNALEVISGVATTYPYQDRNV